MFHDNFEFDDKDTAKGELGNRLHHYDEVDSTIRVMDYDPEQNGFPLSLTPPPEDEEQDTIREFLANEGFETEIKHGIIYVTGNSSA